MPNLYLTQASSTAAVASRTILVTAQRIIVILDLQCMVTVMTIVPPLYMLLEFEALIIFGEVVHLVVDL